MYNVSAKQTSDLIRMPCPVTDCGGEIIASPRSTRVICSKNPKHVFELEPNVPAPKATEPSVLKEETPKETPEAGTSVYETGEMEVASDVSRDAERAAAAALEKRSGEDENPRAFLTTGVL